MISLSVIYLCDTNAVEMFYLENLVLFLAIGSNASNFRLGRYYESGMVLQSGGANIWGWGGPNADVQVCKITRGISLLTV